MNIPYPVIDMNKTGQNIKQLRKERNISVSALQEYLGLGSTQAIYRWQKGSCLPTVDHLCALSHLFGISMNEIVVLQEPTKGGVSVAVPEMKRLETMTNRLIFRAA